MGSLSSRPTVPAQSPQVVFVPSAPTAATTTIQDNTTETSSAVGTQEDAVPTQAEIRTDNLLRRNRGRFGTILTGLSGLLSPVQTQGQRKTLLGE